MDSRGEVVAGGAELPLSRVRCLSGRHPGNMPGEWRRGEIRHDRKEVCDVLNQNVLSL